MRNNKVFDCVRMKNEAAEKVYRMLSGMTPEEQLAFWRDGTKELLKMKKNSKKATPRKTASTRVSA